MSHEHKTSDAGSPQRARVLVALWRIVRRFRGIEDRELRDYELETLKMIRASSFWLRWRSTESLCRAYHSWSTSEYCAGWMSPSPHHIRRFVKWATTWPINESA
jgi:hypothetical protein